MNSLQAICSCGKLLALTMAEKEVLAERTRVLVVEDEKKISDIVRFRLEKEGFLVAIAETAEEGIDKLKNEGFDAVLLDLMLPDKNGLEVLKEVKECSILTPVIVVTGVDRVSVIQDCFRAGAFDFLKKPIDFTALFASLKRAKERLDSVRIQIAAKQLGSQSRGPNIVTASDLMRRLIQYADKAATTNVPVLILGETGTGKEMVASAIHLKSARSWAPFVKINCAGLPQTLVESELFGHERGAFTGADDTKRGLFEVADGGTIFLDEIGDMPMETQSKILRILEGGELRRVGGKTSIYVKVRVIAATNKDLNALSKQGSFRADLYFRLNVIALTVPPLRERAGDVRLLVQHFVEFFNRDTGRGVRISESAIKVLEKYSWPGNVRELRNLMERLVVLSTSQTIDIADLPVEVTLAETNPEISSSYLSIEEVEKRHITKVLQKTKGNRRDAAKILKISEPTLYRKIKDYAIDVPSE